MGRWIAYASTLALSALVLWPATWGGVVDDFPLSSYPMFSMKRTDPTVRLPSALGVTEDGRRVTLAPEIVGTEEVTHAARTLWAAIRRGREAGRALCREMAERVARSRDAELAGVKRVEIVLRRYDAVAYFSGQTEPASSRRHARCKVEREAP
jgi:hypothetical protein